MTENLQRFLKMANNELYGIFKSQIDKSKFIKNSLKNESGQRFSTESNKDHIAQ